MNTKRFIMGLLCAACCCQLSAKGFGRVYGGFSILKQHDDANYFVKDINKGCHVGYMQSFQILGNETPIFFQCGLDGVFTSYHYDEEGVVGGTYYEIDYGFHKERYSTPEYEKFTIYYRRFNISIPLNIAFQIPVGKISIEPFIGANIRFNIIGKMTSDAEYDSYNYNWDFFDGKNTYPYGGYSNATYYYHSGNAQRVQVGLNTGIGINIKHIYVGYTFNPDFNDYIGDSDEVNENELTTYHHFSVGWNF